MWAHAGQGDAEAANWAPDARGQISSAGHGSAMSRFSSLPEDLPRAGPEIYDGMMRCGTSARDWLNLSGISRGTPQFQSLWLVCSQLDFWVERERKATPAGWQEADWVRAQLERNDEMEALLRSLAATVHMGRTGDRDACDRMRALAAPGDEVAPSWLLDESRIYSKYIHQQRAWLHQDRKGKGKGNYDGYQSQGGGKDKGKGKGKKKGAQGADTQA